MKKIMVIGCPGCGKSTFSTALQKATGLPLYHLDMLYWNADKTTVSEEEFLERLSAVIQQAAWIIDGNYGSSMEFRLQSCDTVIFLDYPAEVCLAGIEARRGKPRADLPWVEEEYDPDFIEFIKGFAHTGRPQLLELLSRYPEKDIYTFRDRGSAADFLASCRSDCEERK